MAAGAGGVRFELNGNDQQLELRRPVYNERMSDFIEMYLTERYHFEARTHILGPDAARQLAAALVALADEIDGGHL